MPAQRLIIVRRESRALMRAILEGHDRWPRGTAVMRDRRQAERRVLQQQMALERRTRQRRVALGAGGWVVMPGHQRK